MPLPNKNEHIPHSKPRPPDRRLINSLNPRRTDTLIRSYFYRLVVPNSLERDNRNEVYTTGCSDDPVNSCRIR